MNIQYQHTGNQIHLPMDDMVNFVYNKLYEYDELIKATEMIPEQSPYKDPVYYTTDEGKMVQIPEYIQKQVVEQYMKEKINSVQDTSMLYNQHNQQNHQHNQQNHQYQQQSQIYQQNNSINNQPLNQPQLYNNSKTKKKGSNIKIFLIVIGIILVLYFLYKNYK